jgi:hypothetical protein
MCCGVLDAAGHDDERTRASDHRAVEEDEGRLSFSDVEALVGVWVDV